MRAIDMRYFLLTGRIIGDDEDVSFPVEAETEQRAIEAYIELMWSLDLAHYAGASDPRRVHADENGEGCVINGIFESASPIREI